MSDAHPWARVVVTGGDGVRLVSTLVGDGPPKLADVEVLAYLQLVARRGGGRIELEEVSTLLAGLLDLAGLLQAVGGRPEDRQGPFVITEVVVPGQGCGPAASDTC
jgi:hypothetical protein